MTRYSQSFSCFGIWSLSRNFGDDNLNISFTKEARCTVLRIKDDSSSTHAHGWAIDGKSGHPLIKTFKSETVEIRNWDFREITSFRP